MPRKEHPGIGRRVPRLISALTFIVLGAAAVLKDYSASWIAGVIDWLRDFDATRSFAAEAWRQHRVWFAEPSQGLEWIHIVGMLMIAIGIVLILWRSQRPPERDPE